MTILHHHIIKEISEPTRFLDYVLANIPTLTTRSGAKKAIKKGILTLDGEVVESGRFVSIGQEIIHKEPETPKRIFELSIPVLFEDEYIAVVNKPAGLSTSGNYFHTVENALPFNLKNSSEPDCLQYPKPVHRLDNATSGLLLIAKTKTARIALGTLFEAGRVQKEYHAIVIGALKGCGIINQPINGKECISEYVSVQIVASKRYEHITLVKLFPKTGRTHQLRLHLSQLGNPILGDKLYTESSIVKKDKGLFLCSTGIEFMHPIRQEVIKMEIPIPHKFCVYINKTLK